MNIVRDQKKRLRVRKQQDFADIQAVMSTPAGRRFMWRLLDEANIFRSCFTGNSQTFYLEGRREFMLPFYQDMMAACPDQFFKAQKENLVLEEEDAQPERTSTRSPE